jgi:hypothetical protein
MFKVATYNHEGAPPSPNPPDGRDCVKTVSVFVPEGRCEFSPGLESWEGLWLSELVPEARLSP